MGEGTTCSFKEGAVSIELFTYDVGTPGERHKQTSTLSCNDRRVRC